LFAVLMKQSSGRSRHVLERMAEVLKPNIAKSWLQR